MVFECVLAGGGHVLLREETIRNYVHKDYQLTEGSCKTVKKPSNYGRLFDVRARGKAPSRTPLALSCSCIVVLALMSIEQADLYSLLSARIHARFEMVSSHLLC